MPKNKRPAGIDFLGECRFMIVKSNNNKINPNQPINKSNSNASAGPTIYFYFWDVVIKY